MQTHLSSTWAARRAQLDQRQVATPKNAQHQQPPPRWQAPRQPIMATPPRMQQQQMRQETYDSQMTTMSQQDSQDSQAMTAESMSQSSWAGDVNWGRGGPQTPRRNEPSRGGPQTPMADSFQAPMVPLTGLGPSPTPPRLRPPPSTPRGRTPPLGSSKPAFDKLLTVSSPSSAQGMVSVLAALRDNSNGVGVFAQEVKASIVQAVEELQQRMERKEDTGAAAREELAEAVRTIHDRVGDMSEGLHGMRESESRRADRVETVHQEAIDRHGLIHKTIVALCTKVDSQRDEISALQGSLESFKTAQSAILRELRERELREPLPMLRELPQVRHDSGYQSAAPTPERKAKEQPRAARSYKPYNKPPPPQRAARAEPESSLVLCHSAGSSASGGTQNQRWPVPTRPFAHQRQSFKPAPQPVQEVLEDFSIFEDNFESVAVKQSDKLINKIQRLKSAKQQRRY